MNSYGINSSVSRDVSHGVVLVSNTRETDKPCARGRPSLLTASKPEDYHALLRLIDGAGFGRASWL